MVADNPRQQQRIDKLLLGDGIMQFILDLLWEHSRSTYLTSIGDQETRL